MVVIIGGEPTMRKELPLLIKQIKELGFNVRLSTNGIKLNDENYFKNLVDNGLDWILLQFDGFKKSTSIEFRGVDLIEKKLNVIRISQKFGLKTHLIVMVDKNHNIDEIYRILQYAFDEPAVFAVNLYPVSLTGRYKDQTTYAMDCIKSLEKLSNGMISLKDFIDCKKLWNRLYKIFKKPILRQKICTFPLFFYRHKEILHPINQLFKIKNILKNPVFSLRYILKTRHLIQWENKPIKEFLYFNIEKFYHSEALDIVEAYDCHNVFLTEKGFIPFCLYNSLYRKKKCF